MFAYRTLTTQDANALCSFRNQELARIHCRAYLEHMAPTEAEVSFFLKETAETGTRTLVGMFYEEKLIGIGVVVHHGRSKGEVGGYVAHAWHGESVAAGFSAWVSETWPNYCIMADILPDRSLALRALQGTGLTEEVLAGGCIAWQRSE